MGEITLSVAWVWLIGAFAALISIDKVLDIIKKHLKPEKDVRNTVQDNVTRIVVLEKKQEETDEFRSVMCKVMLAQLNHELSGNDVVNLKAARDDLNEYLTNRG